MSLFEELKRRNVFRVGIAYLVGAWVLAQVAELLLTNFEAPAVVMKSILVVLIIGFPLAMFLAWAYELTPEGIKPEAEVDRRQSITGQTGRKLDRIIIAFLVIALGYFAYDKFATPTPVIPAKKGSEPFSADSTPQISSAAEEKGSDPFSALTPAELTPSKNPSPSCPSSTCLPTRSRNTSLTVSPKNCSIAWRRTTVCALQPALLPFSSRVRTWTWPRLAAS